jgi:hypothetical protein
MQPHRRTNPHSGAQRLLGWSWPRRTGSQQLSSNCDNGNQCKNPCLEQFHGLVFLLACRLFIKKSRIMHSYYNEHSLVASVNRGMFVLVTRGEPKRRLHPGPTVYYYGAGTTVNASNNTAVEPLGLVTRISQSWVPSEPSFRAFTVTASVVGLSTCTATTSCGRPRPPSKATTAPF